MPVVHNIGDGAPKVAMRFFLGAAKISLILLQNVKYRRKYIIFGNSKTYIIYLILNLSG